MQPLDFLKKVLPDDGNYCITTIGEDKKAKNTFVTDAAHIAAFAAAQAKSKGGINVYHAMASYGSETDKFGKITRTKSNVKYLKSIWADIDVRPDKGYQTLEAALLGYSTFLSNSGLPEPSIVFSGGGFHLYWVLKEQITEDVWQPFADGLKALAATHGFKIDPGITGDSARVLRTPGSYNAKWGKEAKVLKHVGEHSLGSLMFMKMAGGIKASVTKAVEKKSEFVLVDSAPIFAGCAQMRHFQEGFPDQTGEHWISCGRLLAQCIDGERIWHTLSEKDERYNEAECAKKWNDSTKFNNGIKCTRFEELNPEGCAGCKLRGKGKTPIALAYKGRPHVEYDEAVASVLAQQELPFGFEFSASGEVITKTRKGEEAELEEIKIARYPFFVKERSVGELTGDENSVVITKWNPQDKWTDIDLPVKDLFTNTLATLADKGIMVLDDRLARKYIRDSYDKLAADKPMVKVHDTYGWKGDKFLLGERLYSFSEGKLAFEVVHLGPDARSLAPYLRPGGAAGKGSFQGWQRAAQSLFAKGHEWQAISLLAGAGAPLLALLDDTEGGTIWSLFDPVGGKGKTTATVAGATVWGSFEGLSTNAADTMNARIAKLGTLKHLPFAYDEMRRDNPAIAKQFVQTFTAGTERARLDRNSILTRLPRSWRTIMLTSANTELVGAIAADDGSEAMSDRVFEIHAESLPLRKGEVNGQLKAEFLNNCGYAALPIIALMLRDLQDINQELRAKEIEFMALLDDSKLRFRAQFAAVIYVIGRLLAENGILVFDHNYYVSWVLNHISENLEQSKPTTPPEFLSRYLREMQGSIITTIEYKPGTGKRHVADTRSGRADIRIETDTKQIIIPQKDFHNWLQERDQSYKSFSKDMEERGILIAKSIKKNIGAGTQYSSGQEYVMIFRLDHEELTGIDNIIQLEQPPVNSASPAKSPRLSALAR